MWNRIYLSVLAVCVGVMAFFTYYSWTWLQSIGAPQAAVEGYLYHSGHGLTFLVISSLCLLILANVVLAKYFTPWAMWATFLFFAIFVVIRTFGVERWFLQFKQASGMTDAGFTLAPLGGVIACIAGAAVVYANQFALVRLQDRLYPKEADPAPPEHDEAPDTQQNEETVAVQGDSE